MGRRLGQHFLLDRTILRRIVDCAGITPDDTVVEIGPGLGTLTRLLVDQAKRVIAIEIDKSLVEKLRQDPVLSNVELVAADALKFDYSSIGDKFKVVANIPYYITTPLLFRLIESKEMITTMTLLLQREVAQRIVAGPGGKDYGVLSITLQLYTKPELKFLVPRNAFSPPPEVDSAVVHFEVLPTPLYNIKDEEFFLKVVRTAFSQRRKKIVNSLRRLGNVRKAALSAGIDPTLRAESLSIQDFSRLADALCRVGS